MGVNDKSNFIKRLEKLDDFYLPFPMLKDYMDGEVKDKTYKEYYNGKPEFLSHIKMNIIKGIILNNDNPFEVLYNLDDECIKSIFYLLAKTHKALNYFDEYSDNFRELKTRNNQGNIENKINDVIQYIMETDQEVDKHINKVVSTKETIDKYSTPNGFITFEYLRALQLSLKNNHYTVQQVFENFLYEMYLILKEEKVDDKTIKKTQIFNTVNSIISDYFQEIKFNHNNDERDYFGIKTNLNNFIKQHYNYETAAGIDLTHSIRK
ncbi:hypothetical protein [Sulfurimonas sp.]|jgi:hypothetical protein|uniref:hypothetical protein n=1 Tax=Sulfurimonas sp. TaxID=2022749 RepID=UPI0025F033E8|nr:hypothetical protein [Sulfurimonas sp.]MBT5935086.1 hypothetical protein [Sulfurimonas sp.]